MKPAVTVALYMLAGCGEPCGWQVERGFEWDAEEFARECWWDHATASDPQELCRYKAANLGLVRWVCSK